MPPEPPPHREPFGTGRLVGIVVGIVLTIAGAEYYALWRARHTDTLPAPAPAAVEAADVAAIGAVDVPSGEAMIGPRLRVSGWALDPSGIARVEMRIDGLRFPAAIGVKRPDIEQAKPGFPDSAAAGFEFEGDLSTHPAAPDVDRRILTAVAIGKSGRETVLARKSVVEPVALSRWRDVASDGPSFHLLPALSGIALGGALELDSEYSAYQSATVRTGMRVPILYLRTTKGAAGDYAFDPDWDIERRCGSRRIAEDALAPTLAYARAKSLPVLLTLNGGIWADASCDVPAWDANDRLEQDKANCQWNDRNEVMPDDALKNLPGSQEAPELGRSLTFNVYASEVRRYKKRNLQQAARHVVDFMREHPELFVGVTLDPDTYMNPFFGEQQWYDYNPGTLRQFRQWLAGAGPYAGAPPPGVPDLSAYRRRKPLTLAQASRLAGRRFRSWDDVDPPRAFPREGAHPFWTDPWVREWELFRRHLVHLHYDELARWLVEAGVPRDRIWSSQGLMAPRGAAMPFALALDSPVKNYDSGGMSVQGAKPRDGHLGAIVYGASAVNDIPMENGRTLFATLEAIDARFAIVEFNTADLGSPQALPGYASGYRALRDLWNAGGRYVSPMAWNGSNGVNAGKPGFVSYTAWRNTPQEDAARDFMLARAGLPLGSLLWTFGTPRHADGDGWTAETGSIALGPGALQASTDEAGKLALHSPRGLALAPEHMGRVVVGVPGEVRVTALDVYGHGPGDAKWELLARGRGEAIVSAAPGRIVALTGARRAAPIDQLKIEITLEAPATALSITRIAVLRPRAG